MKGPKQQHNISTFQNVQEIMKTVLRMIIEDKIYFDDGNM